MAFKKLNPFQNVGANQTAVLPVISQGMTFARIILELGGTALTKSMLSGIRLWLGGKKIWDVTGSHLDDINEYFKLTSNANYLTLWFANPRAKNLADYMVGAIDTSIPYDNFSMEVDIGAATAPTLKAYSEEFAPIREEAEYKGYFRTLVKSVHNVVAGEQSVPVPFGSKQGALIRAVHNFSSVVDKVQMTKDSFHLIHEGSKAALQFAQNEINRTTQADMLVADLVAEDHDMLAVPTLRRDGNPASFDYKLNATAGGVVTCYSDLLQRHEAA